MTFAQRAEKMLGREAFLDALDAHLTTPGGHVFQTTDFFMLARPVPKDAEPSRLIDPYDCFYGRTCDAWWIFFGLGSARKMIEAAPFELAWVGFHRHDRDETEDPRFYEFRELKRIFDGKKQETAAGAKGLSDQGIY